MNHTIQTHQHGPLSEADREALKSTLMPFVQNGLLPMLAGDKPLDEDPDTQNQWVVDTTELLLPHVATLVGTVQFPALPIQPRERITIENLLGEYNPTHINEDEIERALDEIDSAAEISPLDDEEEAIKNELTRAKDMFSWNDVLIIESYSNEHLNDLLPRDFPEWLNDAIDWEATYEKVLRYCERIDIDGAEYILLPAT